MTSNRKYVDLTELSIQRKARTQIEQAKFAIQGLASTATTNGNKDQLAMYALVINLLNDADTTITTIINTPK